MRQLVTGRCADVAQRPRATCRSARSTIRQQVTGAQRPAPRVGRAVNRRIRMTVELATAPTSAGRDGGSLAITIGPPTP